MKQDCRLGLWMYHSGMTKLFLLYLVEVKEMPMLHWYRIMFCWYHIIFIFLLQWNRHILKVSEDWNTSGCCVYRKVRLFFLRDFSLQCLNLQANLCNFKMNMQYYMKNFLSFVLTLLSLLRIAGNYVSIWGFITLLKGTPVVLWTLWQSTFPVLSAPGLEPRALVLSPLQTELPPPVGSKELFT